MVDSIERSSKHIRTSYEANHFAVGCAVDERDGFCFGLAMEEHGVECGGCTVQFALR